MTAVKMSSIRRATLVISSLSSSSAASCHRRVLSLLRPLSQFRRSRALQCLPPLRLPLPLPLRRHPQQSTSLLVEFRRRRRLRVLLLLHRLLLPPLRLQLPLEIAARCSAPSSLERDCARHRQMIAAAPRSQARSLATQLLLRTSAKSRVRLPHLLRNLQRRSPR